MAYGMCYIIIKKNITQTDAEKTAYTAYVGK